MLERLDDRFRVLSLPDMPRTETRYQHTLRGVIDWSHTLAPHRNDCCGHACPCSAAASTCPPPKPLAALNAQEYAQAWADGASENSVLLALRTSARPP